MKCFFTGASGTVGSQLSALLRQQGWALTTTSRQPQSASDSSIHFELGKALPPNLLKGYDVVVHCAHDYFAPKERYFDVNTEGTLALQQASVSQGVKRFIFISSIGAYPNSPTLHGKSKWLTEKRVLANGGLCLRLGFVYGSQISPTWRGFSKVIKRLGFLPMFVPKNTKFYTTHIEDLARLILNLSKQNAPFPMPLIAVNPNPKNLHEILTFILGEKFAYLPIPWRLPWMIARVLELFGWRFKNGSAEIIDSVWGHPQLNRSNQVLPVPFRELLSTHS